MSRRVSMVARHEGYRQHIYVDTVGKQTIGYGFNLEQGLDATESRLVLEYRLNMLDEQLAYMLPFYTRLSAVRQDVLCDMAYNLGINGLLKFKMMIRALEKEDYYQASFEMMNSRWAEQVGHRARELSMLMKNGVDMIR